MDNPPEDIIGKIVDKAEALGAEYAEARYHKSSSNSIISRNGATIGMGFSDYEGVGIRVIFSGAMGFSATNNLSLEGLEKALIEAISKARSASYYMKSPIILSKEKAYRASYSVKEKKRPENLAVEEKIEFLKELWEKSRGSVKKAKVAALFSSYEESVEEKLYVNSDGALISSRIPRISLFYNVSVMGDNGAGANRWQEFSAAGGVELLEQWRIPERLSEQAKILEEILSRAETVSPGSYDVLLGTEIVGLMVHESCGHPMEADRILGREAAQAGESFVTREMLGSRIGNENVTIIDDPTIPGSNGFYLYDDEGVKARARYLYREGVITEFLHNRETAGRLGVKSNGAARAMDYNSEPIVRMANTYFKPGDWSEQELMEELKNGIYVKTYMEWNIDDRRWGQRYVGLEAYRVERGEPIKLLRNPVLEFTTGEIYKKVYAVGKNIEYYAGVCGKGEPGQGVPVWFGGPDILVKNLRVR